MDTTPNLSLPYIAAAQAQKHVTHNEALRILDALVQLAVLSRSVASPPAAPFGGARYIVPIGATGDWAGQDRSVAAFQDGAWALLSPQPGWRAWVADEEALVVFDGAEWIAAGGAMNPAPLVGVNATADTTNRLAVASPASLLSHAGNDHRLKVNKAAAGDTASVLFQTGFSGRAEFGLAGNDDWSVKVSPDGSTWLEALVAERATGRIRLPNTPMREPISANRTYFVSPSGSNANDGLSAGSPLLTIQEAVNRCYQIDSNGFSVTIQLANGTYVESPLVDRQLVGGARLTIQGNAASPQSVVLRASTFHAVRFGGGAKVHLRDLQIETPNTWSQIAAYEMADVYIGNLIFTACQRNHMEINQATVFVAGNYQIAGGAQTHFRLDRLAVFAASGRAMTISNTPGFTSGFAFLTGGSVYNMWSTTWTGAATGKRYDIRYNSSANGGSSSHFPGDVAGTVASGGQYGW